MARVRFPGQKDGTSKVKRIILGSVGVVSLIFVIIMLVVFVPKQKAKVLDTKDRIACPGFRDKSDCTSHGCEYANVKSGPSCYMKKNSFGYKVEDIIKQADGMVATLSSLSKTTPYGPSIPLVTFEVTYLTEEILRIKLYDAKNKRYEVPVQDTFPLLQEKKKVDVKKMAYNISVSEKSDVFSFQVRRTEDNTAIWDSRIGGLVLSDKFLQISSYLPSKNVYGLGEHVHPSIRHDLEYKTWPMFARDRTPEAGFINLYGVHPFYTCLENSSKSHGVLLLNSNAMDVALLPAPAITFRSIGGIIDIFFFVGRDPEHTVKLYTSLVGKPVLPPFWALGFQLSRYGYNSLDNVKAVVERTRKAEIPQSVQFLDIDHMENNRDFTYDKEKFANLKNYMTKTQKEYGLKWIIILDPAIEAVKGYEAFESGMKQNVFIKRSPIWNDEMFPPQLVNYNITFGRVWPSSEVAFPNFFDQNARKWWNDSIVNHHQEVPFDGLWIDMNEPANFATNEDRPFNCPEDEYCWTLKCPTSPYEDPPYNPLKDSGSDRISHMTLCMESLHQHGDHYYRHYDVHSLYGWSQTQITLQAAEKAIGYRSLVISRSTYPSSGRYAGHWLGDNKSTWDDLRYSVIGMLEFNIFGIPYIGADVCGFAKATTPELCKRWMQLGAFYPFFRNHNVLDQKDQDPVALGADVVAASKRAVERRYALNPYLYTLFYRSHLEGSTVVRPLFHEFPSDENTWNIGDQFMWGKCLLISPVLTPGANSLKIYLPDAEWWHFKGTESHREEVKGNYFDENDIHEEIPLHVKSGCIIPTEYYQLNKSNVEMPKNLTLYVFPINDESSGELYVDSLNSTGAIENNIFENYHFSYKNCSLSVKKTGGESRSFDWFVHQVHVFKVKAAKAVKIGSQSISNFSVNTTSNVLTVTVKQKLANIGQITWEDENKKCQMLP
ncbi:Maltase-glucoamylase like protein [Argiope bruennichi]|uniref:alpha-glucosidase n=1 Tax=Argiope bruennichi TaxID=94029 RepID=A0A8T0FE78_ARGBR|nr:Maltase-glucoamylase like protein [Argiope bruennichi]